MLAFATQAIRLKLGVTLIALSVSAVAAPALDTTFNVSGKRNIWFDLPTEKWDEATDAVVQPDGKIVVVGFARKAPVSGVGDISDLTVARLNADGSTDTGFAVSGKLSLDFNGGGRFSDRANAVAIDSVGRIYLAGNSEKNGFVLRLLANGAVDTGYAYQGRLIVGATNASNYRFEDIAIDANGRAVVVGTIEQSNGALNEGIALRALSNGQLDANFTGAPNAGNSVGFRVLSLLYGQPFNDEIKRVAIAADGSIYAAGSFQGTGNDFDFMVYKMNGTNGALEPSFGASGIRRAYMDQGDLYDRLVDFKLLPNGSLRLLGNCRVGNLVATRGCMVGLTATGAYDTGFSSLQSGTAFRSFPVNAECNGYGGEARALVAYGTLDNRVAVIGEQRSRPTGISTGTSSGVCNDVNKIAIQNHTDIQGHYLCGAAISTPAGVEASVSLCSGSHLTLNYSTLGAWANAAVLDALGRLVVVGASVVSAPLSAPIDVDQALARISGL